MAQTTLIYRDPKTGRFISKTSAKRRKIRGKRVPVPAVARDRAGRFIPIARYERPEPLPRPVPVPLPEAFYEEIPLKPSEQDELDELLARFDELDLLDDLDEWTASEQEWYHGEGALEAWRIHKAKGEK